MRSTNNSNAPIVTPELAATLLADLAFMSQGGEQPLAGPFAGHSMAAASAARRALARTQDPLRLVATVETFIAGLAATLGSDVSEPRRWIERIATGAADVRNFDVWDSANDACCAIAYDAPEALTRCMGHLAWAAISVHERETLDYVFTAHAVWDIARELAEHVSESAVGDLIATLAAYSETPSPDAIAA